MDERLMSELISSRKAVRQKYESLKSDIAQAQLKLQQTYKPLTEPLQTLISSIRPTNEKFELKKEEPQSNINFVTPKYSTPKQNQDEQLDFTYQPQYIDESTIGPTSKLMPTPSFLKNINEDVYEANNPTNSSLDMSPNVSILVENTRQAIQDMTQSEGYQQYLADFEELPRKFVDEQIKTLEVDDMYGLTHDMEGEKFQIGQTGREIKIVGSDIVLDNIVYKGTLGLYNLLFKKNPIIYTQNDLKNYMDILDRTNAYRENYKKDGVIRGNKGTKYRTIIKPYLEREKITKQSKKPVSSKSTSRSPYTLRILDAVTKKKGGSILLKYSPNSNTDYVYWRNVNDIVDRLQLLLSSEASGNSNLHNEIISIIEELKESNIIQ